MIEKKYGLIRVSTYPQTMSPEDLARIRSPGKPTYFLCNTAIYYIDENDNWKDVSHPPIKISKLETLFPKTIDAVLDASADQITKLKSLIETPPPEKPFIKGIRHTPGILSTCAEISNAGIVINMTSRWLPTILTVGHGFLGILAGYMDTFIYVFRALMRLSMLLGRIAFKIKFDEEAETLQKQKMIVDILSFINFSLAILCFTSVLCSGPVAITLAWSFGLLGMSGVCYTDYYLPTQQAKQELELRLQSTIDKLLNPAETDPLIDIQELYQLYHKYDHLQYSFKNYIALMVGIGALLICGSAALYTPVAVASILGIISKVASLYLVIINALRVINWYKSRKKVDHLHDDNLNQEFEQQRTSNSCNSPKDAQKFIETFAARKQITFFKTPEFFKNREADPNTRYISNPLATTAVA